jgi:hypothetical protein
VNAAVFMASRFGADRRVLAEARQDDRPLNRSLQIVQWSLAAAGRMRFPRNFAPGDHLVEPSARSAAAELLRAIGESSTEIERQLIGLDDAAGLDGTLKAIERDLRAEIESAATRPKRGDGLASDLQLHVAAEAARALEAADVRPFLMSGTLLGFIRDGRFMPHDYDIDLGLLPDSELPAAVAALDRLPSFDVEVIGPRIVATHSSCVTVDVFTHELREGLLWHATEIHEWWNTPFDLVRTHLDDVPFWIPDAPERYLDENYGTWSHPVPFYDISFDTPNRRYVKGLNTVRFLHSRCIRALRTKDRWLLEAAVRELRDEFGIDLTELLADSPMLSTRPSGPSAT